MRLETTQSLFLAICCHTSLAEGPPEVKVTNIRRVFHNGEHNAFTDLVRFRGKFYLTFRSCPDGHMVHPTARIIIMASDDAPTQAIMSWYSSYEKDDHGNTITAIYMADLEIAPVSSRE